MARLVLAWLACASGGVLACASIAGLEDPAADDAGVVAPPRDAGGPAPPDSGAADVATDQVVDAGPPTARFVLICNGQPMVHRTCAEKRWEYEHCPTPASGTRKVLLKNDGAHGIGYHMRRTWDTTRRYVPGEPEDGQSSELYGFLAPGGSADISAAYAGGVLGLVGSAKPFSLESLADGGRKDDEGVIPWTKPDYAGIPTTSVQIAQISVNEPYGNCFNASRYWN